jgi:hypothetical protein
LLEEDGFESAPFISFVVYSLLKSEDELAVYALEELL